MIHLILATIAKLFSDRMISARHRSCSFHRTSSLKADCAKNITSPPRNGKAVASQGLQNASMPPQWLGNSKQPKVGSHHRGTRSGKIIPRKGNAQGEIGADASSTLPLQSPMSCLFLTVSRHGSSIVILLHTRCFLMQNQSCSIRYAHDLKSKSRGDIATL